MAQLKAGSTIGGVAILVDSPAAVPVNSLNISGTKEANKYIGITNGVLTYGNVESFTWTFGGTLSGFTSGGNSPAVTVINSVYSFPFSSSFSISDIGNLSSSRENLAGHSSDTEGFSSGGYGSFSESSGIDKFPFSSPFVTAADVGNLSQAREDLSGHSSQNLAFSCGGSNFFNDNLNRIDSFPFSSPFATSSDVGNLSVGRMRTASQSSISTGFVSGGYFSPPITRTNVIDKFPFSASFTTATDAGDLSAAREKCTGLSSPSIGFSAGGSPGPTIVNVIDKFPFSASFTTATDAGDLSAARENSCAQSSITDGHVMAGTPSPTSIVDKFPFSTPFTTATNIGNLGFFLADSAGHQY